MHTYQTVLRACMTACFSVVFAALAFSFFGAGAGAAEPAAKKVNDPRNTVSLDGTWEIIFDSENKGREVGWHEAAQFAAAEHRRRR